MTNQFNIRSNLSLELYVRQARNTANGQQWNSAFTGNHQLISKQTQVTRISRASSWQACNHMVIIVLSKRDIDSRMNND